MIQSFQRRHRPFNPASIPTVPPTLPGLKQVGPLAAIVLLLAAAGCRGPRQVQRSDEGMGVQQVLLSDEQIHSPSGDMSARLPRDWVMVDAETLESPHVFAMACNIPYTLSTIFSEIPSDNATKVIYSKEGLRGLCNASFQRRLKRSNGRAALVGDIEEVQVGKHRFGVFTYSTDSMKTLTRTAIFSTTAHLYECSMTHLLINDHPLPTQQVLEDTHQAVLSAIDW